MQENVGNASRKSSTVKLCRRGSAGKGGPPRPTWKVEVKFLLNSVGLPVEDTGQNAQVVLQALPDGVSCGGENGPTSALCLSLRLQLLKFQPAARRSP